MKENKKSKTAKNIFRQTRMLMALIVGLLVTSAAAV
jgi:hypothetical protein